MDTDDLSIEAYDGIIIEAEKFNHDLTLWFGVLSRECKDEKEYLLKSIKLARDIKKSKKEDLFELFFGELPDVKKLNLTLDKIIKNIEEVMKIPYDQRTFEEY